MNICSKILIISFFFSLPRGLLACSCGETTYEELVNIADNIVSAVLIGAYVDTENWRYTTATFKVNEVYKGTASDTLVLRTSADFGTTCGVPLTMGLHYLLLYKDDSDYINHCGGSGVTTPEHKEIVKKMYRAK